MSLSVPLQQRANGENQIVFCNTTGTGLKQVLLLRMQIQGHYCRISVLEGPLLKNGFV